MYIALFLWRFQSTLPARGATGIAGLLRVHFCISIHAPRTGSDFVHHLYRVKRIVISIHAPRTGSDCGRHFSVAAAPHFNPRSPHGERPRYDARGIPAHGISIHAPRTGSDPNGQGDELFQPDFNPRSPHGERLMDALNTAMTCLISIHAPRTGSDLFTPRRRLPMRTYFNPRSPHGERQCPCSRQRAGRYNFNPRSPHGERLHRQTITTPPIHFNPRSPHGERHHPPCRSWDILHHFNPRSPHGERRRSYGSHTRGLHHFNPRSPHGERPAPCRGLSMRSSFQSTLPARGATACPPSAAAPTAYFNPRSPHGERRRHHHQPAL